MYIPCAIFLICELIFTFWRNFMRTSSKIYMALSGVLLVILGIVCLCNTEETILSLAWLMGIFALITGIAALMFYIAVGRSLAGRSGILLTAIIDILIGILFLGNPLIVANTLPIVFAFWTLFGGINIAIRSFDFKQVGFTGWWLILIMGIVGATFGVCALINPIVGAVAITVLVGIALILRGTAYFVEVAGINKFEKFLEGKL